VWSLFLMIGWAVSVLLLTHLVMSR
jgi:hypothetical protein